MKNFLVTGAAGFIGSALAKRLINEGHNVVTIDNLSTGFVEAIPKGVKFFKGNCHDTDIAAELESYDFNAIFHIAGQSSGEISFEDPIYDFKTVDEGYHDQGMFKKRQPFAPNVKNVKI